MSETPLNAHHPLHITSPLKTALLLLVLLALTACATQETGRRSPGVFIDDAVVENVVESEIRASSPDYKGSHISVVSLNGVVLLVGQVPSAALKAQATEVAQGIRRVKRVHNELDVGGPTSFFARTNDGWLTTKVKSRLIANKEIPGTRVKVQTENGVVFLMGLVNRADADKAVAVAQQVYGVQKIVKVFEYLD